MVPLVGGIILSGTAQRVEGAHLFLTLRPQEGHIREACSVTVRNSSGPALGSQEETEKFQIVVFGRDRTIAPAAARASAAG